MTCAWNALDDFEKVLDYDDLDEHIQRVADRIAKRHKVVAFWNKFDEIDFRDMKENETAGFVQ